jgi:hypothetical protein
MEMALQPGFAGLSVSLQATGPQTGLPLVRPLLPVRPPTPEKPGLLVVPLPPQSLLPPENLLPVEPQLVS